MIYNEFISCDTCDTIINLRGQVGYFNVPFNINCPTCLTHIYGEMNMASENTVIKLEIENAHRYQVQLDESQEFYTVELSAEFPTKKIYPRNLKEKQMDLTPFLRSLMFYTDANKAQEALSKSMNFSATFKKRWKMINVYYNLFWNNKTDLLYPKIEKELTRVPFIPLSKVKNNLDASMALHQLLVTTTGISSILPPKTLEEYIRISNLIIPNPQYLKEAQKLSILIYPDFDEIEKKAFGLIDVFNKIYDQLIPIVALRNTNSLENVDKDKYGIMTTNFEELSDFYAKSYEWILDNIDIVIGLNNIISRDDYTKGVNGKKFKNIQNIGSKIKKLDYLDKLEPFSKPTNSINNRIRNAIQHFDSEINYMTQQITFSDEYRGKLNQESMYLMEFADLCIENFSLIFYILELLYQLRKIFYMQDGISPSVSSEGFQKNNPNK